MAARIGQYFLSGDNTEAEVVSILLGADAADYTVQGGFASVGKLRCTVLDFSPERWKSESFRRDLMLATVCSAATWAMILSGTVFVSPWNKSINEALVSHAKRKLYTSESACVALGALRPDLQSVVCVAQAWLLLHGIFDTDEILNESLQNPWNVSPRFLPTLQDTLHRAEIPPSKTSTPFHLFCKDRFSLYLSRKNMLLLVFLMLFSDVRDTWHHLARTDVPTALVDMDRHFQDSASRFRNHAEQR